MGTKTVQMDKATTMMRDVVKYAQEVARDERLRTDIRAALDHGSKASDRIKNDIRDGGYARLAADKRLRKDLRALLDDLDDAGSRLRRRRKGHRGRNVMLALAGVVAAALAFPRVRPWLEERASDMFGSGDAEQDLS